MLDKSMNEFSNNTSYTLYISLLIFYHSKVINKYLILIGVPTISRIVHDI